MKTSSIIQAAVLAVAAALSAVPAGAAKKKAAAAAAPGKPAASKDVMQVLRIYDFETDMDGWRVPDWAWEKNDNASVDVAVSNEQASNGAKALKMNTNFPPKKWSGAYVEIERESGNFMDFTGHQYLMADIFIPAGAPKLKGEIITTVGESWSWTEMRQPVELTPGAWTTIKADITTDGTDWKVRFTDDLRADVRKLGVRVSSPSPSYKGPVYIDNIRLGSLKKK